jgi:hypothetical protein
MTASLFARWSELDFACRDARSGHGSDANDPLSTEVVNAGADIVAAARAALQAKG